jgi:hypothetical protein
MVKMNSKQEIKLVVGANKSMLQVVDDLHTIRGAMIEVSMMLRESLFLRESNQNSAANGYLNELIKKSKSD